MTVVDANILLYAYNADAPQQSAAERWLVELLEGDEVIALPWITIWAFLRISTNPRIWPNPLHPERAFEIVSEWLSQPAVVVLHPGARHQEILKRLVIENGAAGALLTDAVLAALAIENGATLGSTDQDFSRFPGLRWINPFRLPT